MGNTNAETEWQLRRKCRILSPEKVDQIFFPGKGGKSKAAREFCKDCPVIAHCLKSALSGVTDGFQAGTTEPERRQMREFLRVTKIPDLLQYLPESVRKREENPTGVRPKQPKPRNLNPLDDPLYGVEGPTQYELIKMLA